MPKVISSDIKKLPKKYHDQPRYPVITNNIEKQMKDTYRVTTDKMVETLEKKMLSFIK